MTINDEINRIKRNINSAYDSCIAKGASLPTVQDSNNLAACISSIEGGGSGAHDSFSDVPLEVSPDGALQKKSSPFDWSSGEATKGSSSISSLFRRCKGIRKASFPSLTTLSGVSQIFSYSGVEFVSFPVLTNISDSSYLFDYTRKLTSASFPVLTNISESPYLFQSSSIKDIEFPALESTPGGTTHMFCLSEIERVSFPKLKTTSGYYMFSDCSNLREASFPELEDISPHSSYISSLNGFPNSFEACSSLVSLRFPKLRLPKGLYKGKWYLFSDAFTNCTSLKDIYFDGITMSDFEGPEDFEYFSKNFLCRALTGVSGCTVHLSSDLTNSLGAYEHTLLSRMSGSNNKIVYDLNLATVNFNILNSTNYDIYIEGKKVVNNSISCPSVYGNVQVIDKDTSTLLIKTLEDPLIPNGITNVTIDMGAPSKKVSVTLYNNKMNYSPSFEYSGLMISPQTVGGIPSMNVISSTEAHLKFHLTSSDCPSLSFPVTVGNEDVSVKYIIRDGEINPYVRPDFIKDSAPLGGIEEAVSGEYEVIDGYPAQAFDRNNVDTYWVSEFSSDPVDLIYYNPKWMRINSLTFTKSSTYNGAYSSVSMSTSNDNVKYTEESPESPFAIGTPVVFENSSFARYYKFRFKRTESNNVALADIDIDATLYTYKKAIKWQLKYPSATCKAYLNNTLLTEFEDGLGYYCLTPEDLSLPENIFIVKDNDVEIYKNKIDLGGLDSEECYSIRADLTKEATLTLESIDPISSIEVVVNGIPVQEPSQTITTYVGSTISYKVSYSTGFPVERTLVLTKNEVVQVSAERVKVVLEDPDDTYLANVHRWKVWENPTVPLEDGYKAYMSTNQSLKSSYSTLKVLVKGLNAFTCYINSYGESSYDYTYATEAVLDDSIEEPGSFRSTSSYQRDPKSLGDFRECVYNNLDPSKTYRIYISYRKDSGGNAGNDTGTFVYDSKQGGTP